jgi:hypothetical protein
LFLNDVDTFLENKNITGLQTISDDIHKKHPVEFGDHLLSQLTMQCHQHITE